MATDPIFIDLTELVKNPIFTGIQRVEREILSNWNGPGALVPCVYDTKTHGFLEAPPAVLDAAMKGGKAAARFRSGLNAPISRTKAILFNPEVFFDPNRSRKYIELAGEGRARLQWLVYDFIPFLSPGRFPPGTPQHCMPYLYTLRRIEKLAFISHQTKQEFISKISHRSNEGPVLSLGGDGLGLEKQAFHPGRRNFAFVGTVESRKNIREILLAFIDLWTRGFEAEFFLIGRIQSNASAEHSLIDHLQNERRFHYLGHASDSELRDVLRQARATIFVSSEEGFGIPPLESLAVGIPVIVSSTLPSMNDLPEGGRVKVDPVSPATIAAAVEYLSNDANAARLWEEAASLPIPTWRSFVSSLAGWLHAS